MENWSAEVSLALQSAFRVLGLTRPEMPIVIAMLLKSEGFKQYATLGPKLDGAFVSVQTLLNLGERDDTSCFNVRDVKRLVKAASYAFD